MLERGGEGRGGEGEEDRGEEGRGGQGRGGKREEGRGRGRKRGKACIGDIRGRVGNWKKENERWRGTEGKREEGGDS